MNYLTTDTQLTATANAIRTKGQTSGTIEFKTQNGFADAINAIPVGGGTTVVAKAAFTKVTNKTSYTATSSTVTIPEAGTYKVSWCAFAEANHNDYKTRLYKGSAAVGTEHKAEQYNNANLGPFTETLLLAKNDVLTVYARTRSGSSYYTCVFDLIAEKQ